LAHIQRFFYKNIKITTYCAWYFFYIHQSDVWDFFLYIKQQILFSKKKKEIGMVGDWNKKQRYFFKSSIIKGGFFFFNW
jgi:hypothetical protein